jgi:hypothetical protein
VCDNAGSYRASPVVAPGLAPSPRRVRVERVGAWAWRPSLVVRRGCFSAAGERSRGSTGVCTASQVRILARASLAFMRVPASRERTNGPIALHIRGSSQPNPSVHVGSEDRQQSEWPREESNLRTQIRSFLRASRCVSADLGTSSANADFGPSGPPRSRCVSVGHVAPRVAPHGGQELMKPSALPPTVRRPLAPPPRHRPAPRSTGTRCTHSA